MYNNLNCCIFICLLIGNEHDVLILMTIEDDKTGAKKEVIANVKSVITTALIIYYVESSGIFLIIIY